MKALLLLLALLSYGIQASELTPREEFEALYEADAADRRQIEKLAVGSPAWEALWDEVTQRDAMRMKQLRRLLDRYGWPQNARGGGKAITGAFLVIQHATLEDQRWGLPWLEAARERGDADGQMLALLTDRIRVREGRCQRYGTQLTGQADAQGLRVHPVEDPAELDARRAAVGLPPIADYLKLFKGKVDTGIPACPKP